MIEQLTQEVEGMKAEHEKIAQDKQKKDLVQKGYQKGKSEQGLTDDEISGIIEGDKKIPDEVLQMMETLSEEDMAKLLQMYPDLDEIIAQNS
jgi:hypothetical protein